ncbi:hypothetical protein [Viscerimonas tarda]
MINMYRLYCDAFSAYKRYRLQVMLLEYLAAEGIHKNEGITDILKLKPYVDSSLMWKSTSEDIQKSISYLECLKYVIYDTENKTMRIASDGVNALKDGGIQNLANNTFGGLVSIHIQFFCIAISLTALIISMLK